MFLKINDKRMKILLVLIVIGFLIVIGKILYIEIKEYYFLNKNANNLWGRNLPIEGNRGIIMDRNGMPLTDNLTTTSLVFVNNQIKDKDLVATQIAPILKTSKAGLMKHLKKRNSMERVHPEGRRLSADTADQIKNLNLTGVYLVKESKRYYPYLTFLAPSLGFVGIDNQGLSGLELKNNQYLNGTYGHITYTADAKGNDLNKSQKYEKPADGLNLRLTINFNIQAAIERELDNAMIKYKPEQALIIAMDPSSGEILGMSSRPTYDPNQYKKATTEVINRNLPIFSTFEPGSTFKIVTLAAALNEGKIDLHKDHYHDTGRITVENAKIKCWKKGGHGTQTYLEVVQNSCNPGFVVMGQKLGKKTLFKYIRNLGFGSKTGVDLSGEGTGIIFKLNQVGPVELATSAFGQGVSVTAIQQVSALSALVNGGTLYKPYMVKSYLEPVTNQIVKENKPKVIRENIITEKTSREVRETLASVVTNGTGRNAYIEGYEVGGKTGTAQKVKDGRYLDGNYILSFIGFAPADNPKIVVYVAIDNPKNTVQYGGTVSAPIARRIIEDSIDELAINPTNKKLSRKYFWNEVKYIPLPNVIGKNLEDARKKLKNFRVKTEGFGTKVIEQSPVQRKALEGSIIRLLVSN